MAMSKFSHLTRHAYKIFIVSLIAFQVVAKGVTAIAGFDAKPQM